jgi:hypothetical protein
MGKVLEVSEETYQQFTALAEQQHRTPEEMLRRYQSSGSPGRS